MVNCRVRWGNHHQAGQGLRPGRLAPVLLAAALCAGCATQMDAPTGAVSGAVTTPLADLHLVRQRIPEVLQAARAAPYARPAPETCAALAAAVIALDAALGADLDVSESPDNPSLVARGTSTAGDAALGAVRHTAEGVIPFRGWVRKLSGAERESREGAAAIAAGAARRSFLKGLGMARGCAPPAAPLGAASRPAP